MKTTVGNRLPLKLVLLLAVLFSASWSLPAQDLRYAKKVNKKLSNSFYGRGYVYGGDALAAKFIAKEFQKNGLDHFGASFFQPYRFPVNTFPGTLWLRIGKENMQPGTDFVVSSSSPAIDGSFRLERLPDSIGNDSLLLDYFRKFPPEENVFYVVSGKFRRTYGKSFPGVRGMVWLTERKPYWHVSNGDTVVSTVWLKVKKDRFPEQAERLMLEVENLFIPDYSTQNVVAYVRGKKFPDRFVVFTAHYDHLGMMGDRTVYPGANDNASGTAMLLDLARHYAENPPDCSVAFLAVSGEERGLMGSTYFAEHPLFPLDEIDLLVNLDMVGTGSDGITVVNGESYADLFKLFEKINGEGNYVKDVKARGESCNSDHCPFYKKGVQAVFIYTRGKEHPYYHVPDDRSQNLSFTAYNGFFRLLTGVVQEISKP